MTTVEPPIVLLPELTAVLLDLSDCVCNELETTGAGATCWCGLWPGSEVSWEYCGGECAGAVCGMGWVRLVGMAPYEDFPNPAFDIKCHLPLVAQVEVGALRCIPVPAGGELASPEQYADAAIAQVADVYALRRAVICCDKPVALGVYLPVGPQGGCVGGFWTAYVAMDG